MRTREKRVALALLAGVLAVSCVLAWRVPGYLKDSWLMSQLESDDWETRIDAAQKLGERKCLRAVPAIVKLIMEDESETIPTRHGQGHYLESGEYWEENWREASPLVLVLWTMGEDAIPIIDSVISQYDVPGEIFWILGELRNRDTPMKPRSGFDF